MYKYFHLALIFGVSLFVATAHAATGLTSIDYDYGTLRPNQSSITFSDATSSDYDFWLPVGGTKKYEVFVDGAIRTYYDGQIAPPRLVKLRSKQRHLLLARLGRIVVV